MWLLIDSNLLLLFVVGHAGVRYIDAHKRLNDYTIADYALLTDLVRQAEGLIFVPQVLTEVSNLARQISGPARRDIVNAFARVIEQTVETWCPSRLVIDTHDFERLGLSDAILLRVCSTGAGDHDVTLLTADQALAQRALSLDYDVINFPVFRDG